MAENDGAQMHSILLEEREKLRVTVYNRYEGGGHDTGHKGAGPGAVPAG